MGKLVAVTGATGFVGPHLVAALARRGWRLRILVRRWTPLPSLAGVDADLILGDLASESALRELVQGADAVVHAAGLIKAKREADFLPVNRDSAALLSALAPDAHLVLLSSLAAREPQLSAYGASKRAGEAVVATRSGPWAIVRAPAVYGPGDRETLAYFRAIKSGIAPQPRLPSAKLSLIHVADLAEALALTVERPPAPGTYEVDDGRAYGYADMADAAGEAMGRRPWRVSVPRGVMACLASWNEFRQTLGARAQILTRGKVNEIFHPDWSVADRGLAAAIGLEPRYDLTSGFRDTILWYRARHWL
ncbi:NAD-dependent epimerase/dehydratase family protein [Reyranella aquatilis]|uniref:NAD-dependent epimerase/dehydratase family protein n=1 Tax=Reyranella aquatilis TaxID=2035356 RepID=A0ABS8KVM0_9HYPH|nr:NAD-dependent epimerase/dehydratase family protein [Reyranella aquatilis]MCC8429693.1 NAD-dependent epimerase/dehydratase family protein [Reyranella aquatilis]